MHLMSRAGARFFAVVVFALVTVQGPLAASADTSLPLPRFASLRATEVYMRTGPGRRYPIEWVYRFRGMPVEIIARFNHWRKVRDWQGSEGWIHILMLSSKRMALVTGGTEPLRSAPSPTATIVARAQDKVLGRIIECRGAWCRIDAEGVRGWIRRTHIWGVYANETLH